MAAEALALIDFTNLFQPLTCAPAAVTAGNIYCRTARSFAVWVGICSIMLAPLAPQCVDIF